MRGDAPPPIAAIAIDAGDLTLGGGLLALLRPALDTVGPGGAVAVLSTAPSARHDLPTFCRAERHVYAAFEPGTPDRHVIVRGELGFPRPFPERADPATGFAPRGARVEPGGPSYPFTLLEAGRVAPPETAELYRQAVAAQWDGARDIAWDRVPALAPAVERAVAQVMTFLAENELSALYVPSRFLPQIHPAFVETAMFLATQLADEARHIDVFLRRARAGGAALGVSSVTTSQSLLSLVELRDFTEAAFLLSVLGEGTFLDLLRFIEEHAPDEITAEIARRTRADESRHVHFGLAHVRHALACDEGLFPRLEDAVRRRAATLAGVSGVPAPIQDALTILAAGDTAPAAVARGHEAFRALLVTMGDARTKRLVRAGFSAEQAQRLSDLHTPNFM